MWRGFLAGRHPAGDWSGGLAEVKNDVARLQSRLSAVDTRVHEIENAVRQLEGRLLPMPPPASPSPAPASPPPAADSGRAVPHPGNGTFEELFLADVGLSFPQLRERTQRLLQAQPVDLSDAEYADLLRVLDPYLQPGHASSPAARWTRTKLSVWIEAARAASAAHRP